MSTWLTTALTLTKVDRLRHKETKHRRSENIDMAKTWTWQKHRHDITQAEANKITGVCSHRHGETGKRPRR